MAGVVYTFDATGRVSYQFYSCLSQLHREGTYSVRNDSVIIAYKPFTQEEQLAYRLPDNLDTTDYLVRMGKHKMRLKNSSLFVYDTDGEITDFNVDSLGKLSFRIGNYDDTYLLRTFRFNKWEVIDTLRTNNEGYLNLGSYPLPLHSGENKFGIYTEEPARHLIKSFTVQSTVEKVKLETPVFADTIRFSAPTYYELFDEYGDLEKRGTGSFIDCSSCRKGTYYLLFDNNDFTSVRKRPAAKTKTK